MYELDKATFGEFIASKRKEKNMTQKELAEKLFVSDKAVSKWERGLSIPDVTLLIPLSNALGVSVTEILEGKAISEPNSLDTEHVEALVKKALTLSDEHLNNSNSSFKKRIFIFVTTSLFASVEIAIALFILPIINVDFPHMTLWLLVGLAFIFGIYLWLILPEHIPTYYDENKISVINSYGFQLHVPGMYFNNTNWPHILNALRYWSAITLVLSPIVCSLINVIPLSFGITLALQYTFVTIDMIGLFALVYIVGKKY